MLNRTVQPVHFEDFDGHQFERLVFAYMLRTDDWLSLDWYGQVGSDSGRDIWGVREKDGYSQGQKVCILCTNQKNLKYNKVVTDINKVLNGSNGKPDVFVVISGGNVSASLRDKVKTLFSQKQIFSSEIWSASEFEERLRAEAESLLKRFINGEIFPDTQNELRLLVQSSAPQSDEEILTLMIGLFDRPAFYTPFHQESSIPAFKKAITDTIEALNTGIHRLRDGTEIRRIPSRHTVKSQDIRTTLAQIEQMLVKLRAKYDEYIKDGNIRPCGCNVPDCPVFFISGRAASEMDRLRTEILEGFRKLYPAFKVRLMGNSGDSIPNY